MYVKRRYGLSLTTACVCRKKYKKEKNQNRESQISVFSFPNLSQANDWVNGLEKKLSCQDKLNFYHNWSHHQWGVKNQRKRKIFRELFSFSLAEHLPEWCQTDWQQVVSKKNKLLFSHRLLRPLWRPWHGLIQQEESIVLAVNTKCLCAFLMALPSWSLLIRSLTTK